MIDSGVAGSEAIIEKAILESGHDPGEIKAVFLTHAHPDHSVDEVSYRIGDAAFIGDTVPVRGDIPIFINPDAARYSLSVLEKLSGIEIFYPAWDQTYSLEMMRKKLADAKEIINELEGIVCDIDHGMELSALVDLVCERLHTPMWKSNPLFARTIACCRKK